MGGSQFEPAGIFPPNLEHLKQIQNLYLLMLATQNSPDILNVLMDPNLHKAYQQYQMITSTQAHLNSWANSQLQPNLSPQLIPNGLNDYTANLLLTDQNLNMRNLLLKSNWIFFLFNKIS